MDFKFSKGGDENMQTESAGEKKSQRAILLLLLLLVAGFSYIYFFTGIIKPQTASKPAEPPVKSQIVKMPLPPAPTDALLAKAETKPAEPKKEEGAVQPPPVKAPLPPVVVPPPVAKTPPPPPQKLKEEPKKVELAKPKEEPKKVAPVKVAEKKPVVVDKKPVPAKTDAKKTTNEPAPKPKKIAKHEKPAKGEGGATVSGNTWSVQVGLYVLEDALSNDMGRLRKAGLVPVITPGARKKIAMNRLFLSESADRAEAMSALEKLKRHTSDAFILDQGGKHAVYAGSYLLDARAASEMERLTAAGFKVSMKHAEVAIPSQSLSLGPFSDKKAAEATLNKVNAAGLKAVISKQ